MEPKLCGSKLETRAYELKQRWKKIQKTNGVKWVFKGKCKQ